MNSRPSPRTARPTVLDQGDTDSAMNDRPIRRGAATNRSPRLPRAD